MTTTPLTVAYVVKGFLSQINCTSPGWQAQVELDGEDNMFQDLCDYAEMVEKAWDEVLNWELMWDYEVSEPLGVWLGAHLHNTGAFPDANHVRAKIAELVRKGLRHD